MLIRIWWEGLKHLNHRGYLYVWANLAWIALSLPVVTAPAAYAGLALLTHRSHANLSVSMDDFWEGFRRHLKPGIWLASATVIVLVVNISNLTQYAEAPGVVAVYSRWIWMIAIALVIIVQVYALSLLPMMDEPSLWMALRNAFIFTLKNPLITLGLWLSLIPLYALSMVLIPLWMLLTGSITAILINTTIRHRLDADGYHMMPTLS